MDGWNEMDDIHEFADGPESLLPGDDLIFLAMLDDEEQRQRSGRGPDPRYTGGCGCCALPMVAGALLALAGACIVAAR